MQKILQERALEKVRNHTVLLMVRFSRDSTRDCLVIVSSISQGKNKEKPKKYPAVKENKRSYGYYILTVLSWLEETNQLQLNTARDHSVVT